MQIARLRAVFRLPTTPAGALTGYTISDAQLFAYQGSFIKYRITTLENEVPGGRPVIFAPK